MRSKFFLLILFTGIIKTLPAQTGLKVAEGATVKTTDGVVITLKDMDLINNGVITQGAGQGSFRFTGSLNNSISGNNIPLINSVVIAKTGSGKVSLMQDIRVGTSIEFISGLMDLNNHNILLERSALLLNESENARITGTSGGYIQIPYTPGMNASPNPGNLGAIIRPAQDNGPMLIRRGHTVQRNPNSSGQSISRYFDLISIGNTRIRAGLRFNYFDAELNGVPENRLVLNQRTRKFIWSNQGYSYRDAVRNSVEANINSGNSRLTLFASEDLPASSSGTNAWKAWPNPVVGRLFISMTAQNASRIMIRVFDSGGSQVKEQNNTVEPGANWMYVDMSKLPAGSYQVIAECGIEKKTFSVIKQ
jgi:hypothetical protein